MPPVSLAIPFLVGSQQVRPNQLDFAPTHIASWSTPNQAGPSRKIALAAPDNTIWVYPDPGSTLTTQPVDPPPPPSAPLPTIRATSPTPSGTPQTSRANNPRVSPFSNRSRAPSNASSTRTASSRRRVTSFSPPASAHPVVASVSPTTATVASSDGHARGNSLAERAELLETLREQQARNSEEGRPGVGLGINLGRRLDVHGQADHDKTSGTTSPKSVKSLESQHTSIGGRLMGWAKGADSEEQRLQQELDEQVAEIAVEREMELETEKDVRQEEEKKTIEEAMARASPAAMPTAQDHRTHPASAVRRIILERPGHGRIVSMKVFRRLGLLCVLRDVGLLDTFRLKDMKHTSAVDLDMSEHLGVASSSKRTLRLTPFWRWSGIHLAELDSTPLLAVHGLPWSCGMPSHNGDVTRVVLSSVMPGGAIKRETSLDLPGQGCIGLSSLQRGTFMLHSTRSSLTSYPVLRNTKAQHERNARPSSALGIKQNRAISSAHPSPRQHLDAKNAEAEQPLLRKNRSVASLRDAQPPPSSDHNSFAKFLAVKKADWRGDKIQVEGEEPVDSIRLGEGREVERNGGGSWDRIVLEANGSGVGIAGDAVDTFVYDGTSLKIRSTLTLELGDLVQDAAFDPDARILGVLARDKVIHYELRISSAGSEDHVRREVNVKDARGISFGDEGTAWIAHSEGVSSIEPGDPSQSSQVLFAETRAVDAKSLQYAMPSLGAEVWTADGDGDVYRRDLTALFGATAAESANEPEVDRLASPVTCMRLIHAQQPYLVAGDEDGAVRIWNDRTGKLLASWTLFADSVESVAFVDPDSSSILKNHIICACRDGTLGVISLAEIEFLFLIPASRGPLRRVFVSGKDVLLAYATGKARLWNVETMEFRRSTGLDAADDMLTSGNWHEIDFDGRLSQSNSALSPLAARVPSTSDTGRALVCDLRKLASQLKQLPTPHGLAMLSGLLSAFLTFGIDQTIDDVCFTRLGVVEPRNHVLLGVTSEFGSSVFSSDVGAQAWQSSPEETGLRQLIILTLLRPFLDSDEHERHAARVIAFYATSLPEGIVAADLSFFVQFYLDSSNDVQQAARMLFNSTLDRLSENQLEVLVGENEAELPEVQLKRDTPLSQESAQSLLIIGAIALHKYQSVNPATLKAVAETILAILKDPLSAHLDMAIELCSKGYAVWQTFADPMDLLRRLFHLSTRKDTSSINAQARLGVLHVASSNPALFMSTLSMDILDAQSAEGRTSIMKLCVFMARKKPEVLEHGLPRIAEAVVKSLDPNIGKMREDVWQAATVILNELVLAFSTIDFHSGTQKLAVGTHEGAVIMYELKTASRLYVLEPHRAPVSSVTFSPDGRRLLTVSLEEGVVTVWKVGSSLSGFFNVGGPPRQGALGGTGPFKRIEFARVEDAPLKSTSALSDVSVSWPGPRQAKVMIGETAMSFET